MYKDMIDTIGYVKQADPELGEAMDRELGRQRQNIEVTGLNLAQQTETKEGA